MKLDFSFLNRKKNFDKNDLNKSNLLRCLTIYDLIALGVSSTLGSGLYILIGVIISSYTGPSIIITFLIAGICTSLAALCYAEIGAQVPRSGSAYIYIYVTIGEFIAFVVGWSLILEYVILTSSLASALSGYIDNLCDYKISETLKSVMPINSDFLAPYPDFLAFAFVILMTNTSGDNITCQETNRCGNGGFIPFGVFSMLSGVAKCFFAFIGFDVIATAGEEAINPNKSIPLSILITILISSLAYFGVSTVISLMVPYYVFDEKAVLSDAFSYVGLEWASIITSIGAIISIISCMYGAMFATPRIFYNMSIDGLLFKFLSYLLPKFNTPIFACLITCLLSGFLVLIFDLNQLVDMVSIGTLLAYGLVSLCTLVLRYRPANLNKENEIVNENDCKNKTIFSYLFGHSNESILKRFFKPSLNEPTKESAYLVNTVVIIAGIDMFVISLLINVADITQVVVYVFVIIFGLILFVLTYILWAQPQNQNIATFKVPLMPITPLISSFLNIFLMTTLNSATWIRFIIWFIIGGLIYIFYSIRFSKENKLTSDICCPCFYGDYQIMDNKANKDEIFYINKTIISDEKSDKVDNETND